MYRRFILLSTLLFCLIQNSFALKTDSLYAHQNISDGLRVSILTCGVGEELYASFGHTAVRIIDSVKGTDLVYNYGVFNPYDPDFYSKFIIGKLLYYVGKNSFDNFMRTFTIEQRTVQEQILNLPDSSKQAIQTYLETNLLPQNRAYYYDFLFDNCATRVRDIFPQVLGDKFEFGAILKGENISYRQLLNHYLAQKHWERFGGDLVMGSLADSTMTDMGSMFLPDYLFKGLEKATYNGQPIVASSRYLLSKAHLESHPLDGPMWFNIGIFILTLLSFQANAFRYLKGIMKFLLLFVSGLLGCLLLFLWLGTAHNAFANNYHILWALPSNLLIAFIAHKKIRFLKYYALAGIVLIFMALILSFVGIQELPLFELAPFLLCLLYVYVDLWKQHSKSQNITAQGTL